MREIKFRAWDGKRLIDGATAFAEMLHVGFGGTVRKVTGHTDWLEKVHFHGSELVENITLMQYTGLKDKNGKEIYEGDVVVKDGYIWFTDEGKPNYRGIVEWYYSAWNVSVTSVNSDNLGGATGQGFNEEGLNEGAISDWEVIGNIHENPDLVK